MADFKEGNRVRVATRQPTDEDMKTGLYYAHFGGLTGTIQKVYSKTEVLVDIEMESLSKEMRKRHDDVRDQMKTKWLEGLSEEGRSRLTEREKDFNLRYAVLVAMTDLEKAGARPQSTKPEAPAKADPEAASTPLPPRKTTAELEAAEEEFLRSRAAETVQGS